MIAIVFARRWPYFESGLKSCQVFLAFLFSVTDSFPADLGFVVPSGRLAVSTLSPVNFYQMTFLPDGRIIAGPDDWSSQRALRILSPDLMIDPSFSLEGAAP